VPERGGAGLGTGVGVPQVFLRAMSAHIQGQSICDATIANR